MASMSLCRFAGCLEDVTETTMRFRDATGRVNQCTHVGWHPFFGVVYVFPDLDQNLISWQEIMKRYHVTLVEETFFFENRLNGFVEFKAARDECSVGR